MKRHSLTVDIRHQPASRAMPPPVAPLERVLPPTPIVCDHCMIWHLPPKCSHNPETRCVGGCGGKVGYRWRDDRGQPAGDGTHCWTCTTAEARHGLAL